MMTLNTGRTADEGREREHNHPLGRARYDCPRCEEVRNMLAPSPAREVVCQKHHGSDVRCTQCDRQRAEAREVAAECWTCRRVMRRVEADPAESLSEAYRYLAHRSATDKCRAAGHDVRPVEVKR